MTSQPVLVDNMVALSSCEWCLKKKSRLPRTLLKTDDSMQYLRGVDLL
jgi:hypothetical protein